MNNKRQIRLNTIIASNWVQPKIFLFNTSKTIPTKISSSGPKPLFSPKRKRCLTQIKQPDPKLKAIITSNISQKSTMRPFPKRQSTLKNGNQYRYFLSSSKKILTQQPEQDAFYQKIHALMENGSLPIHKGPITSRRSIHTSKSKKNSKKSLPFKTATSLKSQAKNNHNPEPWFMREENEWDVCLYHHN